MPPRAPGAEATRACRNGAAYAPREALPEGYGTAERKQANGKYAPGALGQCKDEILAAPSGKAGSAREYRR